jgi:hypothetical protein
LAPLQAPLDALLHQDGLLVEAHLLDLLTDAGVVSINGDGKNSGELLGRFARDGEGLREN